MNRLAQDSSARLPRIDIGAEAPSRSLGALAAAAGKVVLPLASVEVRARVAQRVASVSIMQTFRNAGPEALKAVYIFPLPGGAAVSSLEMSVGGRVIRAVVGEREAARAAYEKAVDMGHRGALLEQERDDVFTLDVGNVAPGETIAVRVSYAERLPSFDDGRTELRLPLVVAPRYIPGSPIDRRDAGQGVENDTDVVGDASRITPPRLAPGLDPDVALSVEVELLSSGAATRPDGGADAVAGVDPLAGDSIVDDLECSQHAMRLSGGGFGIRVTLAREGERLDRDFVLRWRASGASAGATLLACRCADGRRYGMLTLTAPPAERAKVPARDVVVLVDRSGSMKGEKLAGAARAAGFLLETLGPLDRLEVVAFDDTPTTMAGALIPADEAGLARAGRFLRAIEPGGGTELDVALERALAILNGRGFAAEERVGVLLVVTDGQVGDEERVISRAKKGLGRSRLFAVGIDTAVNHAFLGRLAKIGGGAAAFVEPGTQLENALRAFGREIGAPFATDLALEDEGARVESGSLAPARLPDLFSGRAATVFVRLGAATGGRVRVRGRALSGGAFDVGAVAREVDLPAIGILWAKSRVQDLEDAASIAAPAERAQLEKQIIAIALEHGLVTRLTAFVALDTAEVVKSASGRRTIVQPVAEPAGWEASQLEVGVVARRAVSCASPPSGGSGYGGFGGPKSSGGPQLTAAGMTLGTVVYMPPEQLMGRDLTPAADIYSLGVTLYELLAGRLPFYHDNEMQLMKMIMKDPVVPPSAHVTGIPPELDQVVLRALEKDRSRRYQTAREMTRALEEAQRLVAPLASEETPRASPPWTEVSTAEAPPGPAEPLPAGVPERVDRYRLERRLGETGMAVVFAASDEESGAPVHVHMLHPNLVTADSIRRRFLHDAQAGMRFSHPGIGRVLATVNDPDGVFIVVEAIAGESLEGVLAREGVPSPARAIAILLQALAILDAVHAERILHRNVSPAAFVVSKDGVVRMPYMEGLPDDRLEGARSTAVPVRERVLRVPKTPRAKVPSVWRRLVGMFRREP